MQVYRICLTKWATKLTASGQPARWNAKGQFVIYSAGSRALACLENVVHRSGEGLNQHFSVMVIDIPDRIRIQKMPLADLQDDWYQFENYYRTQQLGYDWLLKNKTAVLQVPSSVISSEYNFLLNPSHPDFAQIKLLRTELFVFDPRIKE